MNINFESEALKHFDSRNMNGLRKRLERDFSDFENINIRKEGDKIIFYGDDNCVLDYVHILPDQKI